MSEDWISIDTTVHQDHVIAHVLGASVLGYFVSDETLHVVLDMEFIWTIYLDTQMLLLPYAVAISELDDPQKELIRGEIDRLLANGNDISFERVEPIGVAGPIEEVTLYGRNDERRIVLRWDTETLVIETSVDERQISIRNG